MKITHLPKLLAVSLFLLPFSLAAEEGMEMESEWTSGEVVKMQDNQLDLKEFDVDAQKDVTRSYKISSNVDLQEGVKLADIKAGKNVEIEYVVKGDTKIVKSLDLVDEDSRESSPYQEDENQQEENYQPY